MTLVLASPARVAPVWPTFFSRRPSEKRPSFSSSSVFWMAATEPSVEASSTITHSKSRKVWRATERIASPI